MDASVRNPQKQLTFANDMANISFFQEATNTQNRTQTVNVYVDFWKSIIEMSVLLSAKDVRDRRDNGGNYTSCWGRTPGEPDDLLYEYWMRIDFVCIRDLYIYKSTN